jgi:hypothetical protein
VLAFTTAGSLVSLDQAGAAARRRRRQLGGQRLAVAALHADALLLDVGSTTADAIPIVAGRVAAEAHRPRPAPGGRARLHRRPAHEPRDDRSARAGGDRWCPVASELFAISADVT